MVDLEFRVTRMPSEIRKINSKDLSKRVKREGSLFCSKAKMCVGLPSKSIRASTLGSMYSNKCRIHQRSIW